MRVKFYSLALLPEIDSPFELNVFQSIDFGMFK